MRGMYQSYQWHKSHKSHKSPPARAPFAQVVVATVFAFALTGNLACAPEDPRPDPLADYPAYVGWASRKICFRIQNCFAKIHRSVSPAMQKEITVANCSAAALEDLDEKLAIHTASMKSNSVQCYETLLEANCLDFGALAYWDPSCMMLRRETDAIYKKAAGVPGY